MVKAVFTHADGSIYDDLPETHYHFPRTYLAVAERAVGDWIVYYEPRRVAAGSDRAGGRQVYFAVAQVRDVIRDPARADHFYARMTPGMYLPFPTPVPFRVAADGGWGGADGGDLYMESALRKADGSTNKGAFGRAMRSLPDAEFEAIVAAGLAGVRDELGAEDWMQDERRDETGDETGDGAGNQAPAPPPARRRWGAFPEAEALEAAEPPAEFSPRPLVERLTARRLRDAAFARQVKAAYRETCAVTGLRIVNGGGRPEVQAAHIRAVEADGPDALRNGVALSGTAHWMFDRGLISIDDDLSILTARDRLPPGAEALLVADRRLIAPQAAAARPHPVYLRWHRDTVFKG